jgi:hypothetical protein
MFKVTTYYTTAEFNPRQIECITIEGIKADGKPLFKSWNNPESENDYIQSTWISKALELCEAIADEHGQGIAWQHSKA